FCSGFRPSLASSHLRNPAKQTKDILDGAGLSPHDLGREVEAALAPREATTAPRVAEAFSAFWEASGVMLLEPTVPEPEELARRFVPALDKFLVASSINIHEPVDEQS